ncbi:MAG: hypothetical protein WCK89_08515 [bacterium]
MPQHNRYRGYAYYWTSSTVPVWAGSVQMTTSRGGASRDRVIRVACGVVTVAAPLVEAVVPQRHAEVRLKLSTSPPPADK